MLCTCFECSSKEAINKKQSKLNKKHWKHLHFYTFDNFVKLQEAPGGFGADVYSYLWCLRHAGCLNSMLSLYFNTSSDIVMLGGDRYRLNKTKAEATLICTTVSRRVVPSKRWCETLRNKVVIARAYYRLRSSVLV